MPRLSSFMEEEPGPGEGAPRRLGTHSSLLAAPGTAPRHPASSLSGGLAEARPASFGVSWCPAVGKKAWLVLALHTEVMFPAAHKVQPTQGPLEVVLGLNWVHGPGGELASTWL